MANFADPKHPTPQEAYDWMEEYLINMGAPAWSFAILEVLKPTKERSAS